MTEGVSQIRDEPTGSGDARPGLAVVANALTPYRVHLHRRIAEELPQFKLHTVLTHAAAEFAWDIALPDSIHAVGFATGDEKTSDAGVKRAIPDWRKAGRILDYFAAHDVRAVVLMGYNDATRMRLLSACRGRGIKVFLRADSNIKGETRVGGLRAWLKHRVVRYAVGRSDLVMPMGRLGQAFFEKYGADATRCVWVPYEPDYQRFAEVDREAVDAFCAGHGLVEPGRRRLLFCGRLARVKRVDLLLEAFGRIAAERPEWDLLIAGDGPLRVHLQAQPSAEVAARIKWLGFLDGDALIHAYHAADVLVLPSDYEPWALVVNEALAAGLVVVASDVVGAAYELVRDGRNGRLFKVGDADALTAALRDVTDPEAIERYRAEVGPALADWRRRADPVEGIRQALRKVGLLEGCCAMAQIGSASV